MDDVSTLTNPRLGRREIRVPQPPVIDCKPWSALSRLDIDDRGTHFGKRDDEGCWDLLLSWLVEGLKKSTCSAIAKICMLLFQKHGYKPSQKPMLPVNKLSKWIHQATEKHTKYDFVDSSVGLLWTGQNKRCEHNPVSKILLSTRQQTLRRMNGTREIARRCRFQTQPTHPNSTIIDNRSLTPTINMSDINEIREKYRQFRILVIGRANAGKTTLLKRVCNTDEEPCIYDEENKNLVRTCQPGGLCSDSDILAISWSQQKRQPLLSSWRVSY